ncbi:hypothetical protein [Cysteiniphilum sp. QT6929]|uniref:hypothetical protein n=1 Tax=Cysteiniphilum sp. QT6929 TaxID=2975055 RepID=UPI0024B3393A|nr:hypothetical protein [Cysteiniphilum sp. QT6929]WHN66258.1 hypothetical protein NYP54_03240 [Cysteiniphilum sp. QT6929]
MYKTGIIQQGNYANSDIFYRKDKIEKTFAAKHWLIRNTVGRWFIHKECRIYKKWNL